MGLVNQIKRWWNNDMNLNSIRENKDFFYSSDINKWYKLYSNKAEWVDNEVVYSLNLGKSIVKEVSKTATQEFDFIVETKNKDILNAYSFITKNKREIINHLQVGGKVALKPYISNDRVLLTVVSALDFKAEYDALGRLFKVFFKTDKTDGYTKYRLIEEHTQDYTTNTYKIDYKLIKDNGSQVPLHTLPEFERLDDFVIFEDITKHLCTVISIDAPIFADAYELIEQADKQYSRLLWEYEGGELAINANADLFRRSGSSTKKQYELPKGKERLYRALDTDNNEFTIDTYAPTLRDDNYIKGLNSIKREIEFACGLAYGTLSEPSTVEKTATEIAASKQRYYVTISDIRNAFIQGIEDILGSIALLSSRLAPSPTLVDSVYTVIYDIGDSILTTSKEKLEEKLLLFDKGLLTVDEFKEWYNS